MKLTHYRNWPSLMTTTLMPFNHQRVTHNPPLWLFATVKKPSIASQVASTIVMEDVVVIPETEEDESKDKEDSSNKPVPK